MTAAVIFDMDGLLIDSEPFWVQAEVEILTSVGVPLTPEMTAQTMGLRIDEVVAHWRGRYAWDSPPREEVEARIIARVIELVNERGEAKPGALHAVELVKQAGLKAAIASSSQERIIAAVLARLSMHGYFDALQSAEHEPYGKPHPGVYLAAAQSLGVEPTSCLALEDSPNGVLSAKAARMRCFAVPEPELRGDKRFGIADAVLGSLEDLTPALLRA